MASNRLLIASKIGVAAAFIGCLTTAFAEVDTESALKDIGTETALLTAKAKREKARLDLEKNISEREKLLGVTSASDPTINWIEGVGSNIAAQLQLENGAKMEVRAGELVGGTGYRVVTVKPGEVVIEKKKRRIRLNFSAATQSSSGNMLGTPGMPGAAPGLPPVPTAIR